jgi:cobalt-zinc-cadmium efflux system outer membrane protein
MRKGESMWEKIVFLSWLFSALFLNAREGPPALEDLVARALERNPRIMVAAREAEAYSFKVIPARTLPDPMVEFSLMNMGLSSFTLGMDPNSGLGISLSQDFPFPGKLRLKGEVAASAYQRKLEELEAVKREVIRKLKNSYYELFYVRRALAIYSRQKELLLQARKLSEEKYAVGGGAQSDILKAMTAISRMDEMIIPMREMATSLETEINLALDYPPDNPLGEITAVETAALTDTLAELRAKALDASPMVREAKLMAQENEKMTAMARKEFFPDIRVTAGWEYKGALTDMFKAMIGLEIPLYQHRRQSNGLKEARAMESASRSNAKAVANDTLAMLTENYLQARTAASLIALYQNQLRLQARLTVESSLANYQVNRTDFLSLLMDIDTQFAVEVAYGRELARFWQAMAAIESLTAGRGAVQK